MVRAFPRARWFVLVLALALPVAAEEPTAQLHYRSSSAPACPDEASVRRAVAAMLGRDPFRADAALVVDASVVPSGSGLKATIALKEGKEVVGEKVVSSPALDCRELASAMVLAIALAVDPLAGAPKLPEPTPQPQPEPKPEPVPVPAPVVVVVKMDTPPATPQPRNRQLGAGAMISGFEAPSVSGAGWVEGRYRWTLVSIGLNLEIGAPVRSTFSLGSMTSWRLTGSVVPCVHLGWFVGCGRATAGAMTFSGERVDDAQTATTFAAALGVRAGVDIPVLPQISVRAWGDVGFPLTRFTLTIGDTTVWETQPVTFAGAVGAAWNF